MKYDHVINADSQLNAECFHLSCGFYETTSFLFEKADFSVVIHCKGEFAFYAPDGSKVMTYKAKRMASGRGCYMDVLITTTDNAVIFQLPQYDWIDHYPNCDGESDRWTAQITGINDEIVYPQKP